MLARFQTPLKEFKKKSYAHRVKHKRPYNSNKRGRGRSIHTRLDISFEGSQLGGLLISRVMASPQAAHLDAVFYVLEHINHTDDHRPVLTVQERLPCRHPRAH